MKAQLLIDGESVEESYSKFVGEDFVNDYKEFHDADFEEAAEGRVRGAFRKGYLTDSDENDYYDVLLWNDNAAKTIRIVRAVMRLQITVVPPT